MPTKIPWTDDPWNVVLGCEPESPGCIHCYAAAMAHRGLCEAHRGLTVIGKDGPMFNGEIRLMPARLPEPLHWKKPRRVFVPSMGDLFHEDVPDPYIAAVFGIMAAAREHTFQVLTKRARRLPEVLEWIVGKGSLGWSWQTLYARVAEYSPEAALFIDEHDLMSSPWPWPLPNVWLGVSVESPKVLHRVDELKKCEAAVRFLSCEPLLDRLDLGPALADGEIHWVIVGGESGRKARPCAMEWIEEIVSQCAAAGVACFVKQLGATVVSEERMADTLEDAQDMLGPKKKDRWLWYGGFAHPAAADPEEWPEQFRVQEYPDGK